MCWGITITVSDKYSCKSFQSSFIDFLCFLWFLIFVLFDSISFFNKLDLTWFVSELFFFWKTYGGTQRNTFSNLSGQGNMSLEQNALQHKWSNAGNVHKITEQLWILVFRKCISNRIYVCVWMKENPPYSSLIWSLQCFWILDNPKVLPSNPKEICDLFANLFTFEIKTEA